MSFNQILKGSFKYWYSKLHYYLPLYFAVHLAIAGAAGVLIYLSGFNPWLLRIASFLIPSLLPSTPIFLPPIDVLTLGFLAGLATIFLCYALLQALIAGTVVKHSADLHAGLKPNLRESFSQAWGRILPILGAYLLATLLPIALIGSGIFVPLFLPLLFGIWTMTTPQLVLWFGVVILSSIIAFVLTLLVVIRFAVYLPVAVLSKARALESLHKSWQLVKGNDWRTLALILLVGVVGGAIIGSVAPFTFWLWLMPTLPHFIILTNILLFLAMSIAMPLASTMPTMLYLDLKGRTKLK